MDGSKLPPRSPNVSKLFKPQPSPTVMNDNLDSNGPSFLNLIFHLQSNHSQAIRHPAPAERAAPWATYSDAIMPSGKVSKRQSCPIRLVYNRLTWIAYEYNRRKWNSDLVLQQSFHSRRHSIEIIDTKSPKSPLKPQLAPKPSSGRIIHGSNLWIRFFYGRSAYRGVKHWAM
jgi:hypothetical protein